MNEAFWPEREINRRAPTNTDPNRVTYFGETDARNKRVPFGIKAKDRDRHMYVIGKTGMGKSTLLENLSIQDIRNGEGLCFIDPHGKTADLLLEYVPQERVQDVLYFAPFDKDYPISFNVMEDVGEDKRHLVVSGLMSAFKKIWGEDTFSARMEYILQNTIHALIEYPDATLLGINRMYTDKAFRKKVVDNVTDTAVKAFWEEEFAGYTDRFAAEATPAIQNKIGQFTANPIIRNIVGQPTSSFDLRELMDQGKIMIVNLSKGRVGESNANLLGSMLITKLYLAAMSRADITGEASMPDFYLFVDEFQSFANESFADILSEARKYKLNLTIAHQYMAQMSEEVRDAVIGNVGTMITFRIGAYDAEILEKEFQPTFTMEDMVNLGFAQVYLKLMIDGVTSPPFSASTLPPIEKPEVSFRDEIVASSRSQFASPRNEVEETIKAWQQPVEGASGGGKQANEQKQSSDRRGGGKQQGKQKGGGDSKQNKPKPSHQSLPQGDEEEQKNPFANLAFDESGRLRADAADAQSKKHDAPRQQKRDDKGPTEENRNELRETLSSLIGASGAEEKKEGGNQAREHSGKSEKGEKMRSHADRSRGRQEASAASHDTEPSPDSAQVQTSRPERKRKAKKKKGREESSTDEGADGAGGPREISREQLEQILKTEDE